MAKLQQVLSEEIRRMSRKEVSGLVKALRTQISGLRDLVKELNGRVKALEKFGVRYYRAYEGLAIVSDQNEAGCETHERTAMELL